MIFYCCEKPFHLDVIPSHRFILKINYIHVQHLLGWIDRHVTRKGQHDNGFNYKHQLWLNCGKFWCLNILQYLNRLMVL